MQVCDNIYQKLEKGVSFVITSWIPKEPWIAAVAGFAAWYGRRVALTYAPGYLANYFIKATVTFIGSETIGKITGATIVAPLITPTLTPWVAAAAGFAMFCVISIICNLVKKLFDKYCCPKKEEKEAELCPEA